MLRYEISASLQPGGKASAMANHTEIVFDATSDREKTLPNPAEILLTSLAACMMKNVQRYSEILHIPYRYARVSIQGVRAEHPPMMSEILYRLEVDTDVDEVGRRLSDSGDANMICLAKVAISDQPLIKKTKEQKSRIVVLDGCAFNCAEKILENEGFTNLIHLNTTDFGIVKGKTPVSNERIDAIVSHIKQMSQ
ncbi:MAG: hypothetical protein DRI97_12645 [Bacteroidetes bacterium]|nr:MAG: hypothetical protein DRI97_12645 [Bacteroidota bacterium]